MEEYIITSFIEKGFLISPDLINFEIIDFENLINKLINMQEKPIIINKNIVEFCNNSDSLLNINWNGFDKSKVDYEKGRSKEIYNIYLDMLDYNISEEKKSKIDNIMTEIKIPVKDKGYEKEEILEGGVIILKSYNEKTTKKREIQDFVKYYKARYDKIKEILLERIDLQNTVSINKLSLYEKQNINLIGYIITKNQTKNNNWILSIEDSTGVINLLVSKDKKELYEIAKDLVLDDIVGISGTVSGDIIFVNNIILPDIPFDIKSKKSSEDCFAVFISDIHFGIKNFLEFEFSNFINWLGGEYGNNEQKELSKKIKYLFIIGDVVEGVGIYPGQEEDLKIKDIYKQYEYIHEYLKKIPNNIKIIICPGNHDAVRLAEPQPGFNIQIKKMFSDLENLTLVSNPALVNINSSKNFEGFNVLMYHGFSFPYYIENVESIRFNGGMDRSDLIMKFLLQRRHLAPTHNSNQYIPDTNEDPLVIDKVPDLFVTGHIHKVSTTNYRGVICLNCSCWLSQTKDNEKRGIIPDPAKAILVNLKTRGIKIMNFLKDDV